MKRLLNIVLAAAALLALAAAGQEKAADPPAASLDRAQVERRIGSVGILLDKSSAARHIEASGDAAAKEKRERARKAFAQANEAFQSGDLETASRLLNTASGLMIEAGRLAAPEQVKSPKQQADFAARRESVRALLAAQRRISGEKPTPGSAEATQAIDKLVQEADALAATGRLEEARNTLERGYLIARAAITSVREGETLVRSLHFASKEEEFRYEVDRNETHQMLIKMLLADKRGSAGVDTMVTNFVTKATRLRADADAASQRGDYVEGIRLLDESTKELVRAIRSAGIYIPG